ncbi:hypothetical protein SAMN05216226_10892 [Halovenus aranensis]|jgi:hypothetical protein|uniref:Uncharacterized protein n=1 Tax=Halovenus aranensis TaxID=890420 RepID=A0A1G8W7Z6_9EURY|nr:hypothetical protein [Halovenus aranensis]SDJ73630.1 hypothetical protein SAMN05216226_10892 [Halovenus aranensis]
MSYDKNSEVIGKYIVAFIESAGEVSPVFERKMQNMFDERIGTVNADEWYDTESVVETYQQVLSEVGEQSVMKAGQQNAVVVQPPADEGLKAALEHLNEEHRQAFRDSHKEYPAGRYTFDIQERDAHLGVDNDYPFPRPFVHGFYQKFIDLYGPGDSSADLDETAPRPNEQFAWEATW